MPASLPAHPRLRGEHQECALVLLDGAGSSPLTRGALVVGGSVVYVCRLIPAYAGSTHPLRCPIVCRWAHPRLRGEHKSRRDKATSNGGSSPLTRGARRCNDNGIGSDRLIPAYAGSTRLLFRRGCAARAHPRLRGEHTHPNEPTPVSPGSSPLTRGAPRTMNALTPPPRLIPAYAGSTDECRPLVPE